MLESRVNNEFGMGLILGLPESADGHQDGDTSYIVHNDHNKLHGLGFSL